MPLRAPCGRPVRATPGLPLHCALRRNVPLALPWLHAVEQLMSDDKQPSDNVTYISQEAAAADMEFRKRLQRQMRNFEVLTAVMFLSLAGLCGFFGWKFLVDLPRQAVPDVCPNRDELVSVDRTFSQDRIIVFLDEADYSAVDCKWVTPEELAEFERESGFQRRIPEGSR